MIDQTETVSSPTNPEEVELAVFSKLTANQQRYVRLWIEGGKTQAEVYREAYNGCDQTDASVRTCASRTHNNPKVQAAIRLLVGKENRAALATREEKRQFLTNVIRAHTPEMRAIDPKSPYLDHSPMQAIKTDNEMAGHVAATEVQGNITLKGILEDLQSSPLVDTTPKAPLPIPAAGGGYGELPENRSTADGERTNGSGGSDGDDPITPALERFGRG